MKLDAIDLSSLEVLRPVLPLPMWQKAVAVLVGFVLILAAYFYFGWLPVQSEIKQQKQRVEQQRFILRKNEILARDLPRKRREYAQLEKQLKVALSMLPKESEIPDLLENVSFAGKNSGLQFRVFKPLGEQPKQFYADVPVALDVSGTYLQLLTFLRRVGEMPRIVDVSGLTLARSKSATNVLSIKGTVITYRFIEKKTAATRRGRR